MATASAALPGLDLAVVDRPGVQAIMARCIDQSGKNLNILEAGCGRRWPFKKGSHTITDIDMDQHALDFRRDQQNDLDVAVLGDLRELELPTASFDVIYSAFVLEHVDGAEKVLDNFVSWLKPGGLLMLTFPDRDGVYGFFTRITPFWFHVLYKKYVEGIKNAGKPGFVPYETFHD
ncbi:MAG: class I SAM-dependent methyltransferase [Woeseiaceae bacterium]